MKLYTSEIKDLPIANGYENECIYFWFDSHSRIPVFFYFLVLIKQNSNECDKCEKNKKIDDKKMQKRSIFR